MTKLLLKINPMFGIRGLLNEKYAKGGLTLDMLKHAQNIIEKVAVDIVWSDKPEKDGVIKAVGKELAKKVNLRRVSVKQGGNDIQQIVWDVEKDTGTDIEFSEDQAKLLTELIKAKSDSKELKTDDMWILDVAEQLGL